MVAVVDNWIIVNIPVAIAMELDQFNIRIELLSQRQTKEPTIFAVNVDETGQASVITVPSDKLGGVEKDSTYSVKVGNLTISFPLPKLIIASADQACV